MELSAVSITKLKFNPRYSILKDIKKRKIMFFLKLIIHLKPVKQQM